MYYPSIIGYLLARFIAGLYTLIPASSLYLGRMHSREQPNNVHFRLATFWTTLWRCLGRYNLSCRVCLINLWDGLKDSDAGVKIAAGETVFYNNNILHCATYNSKKKRATLHACMGNSKGGPSRAKNILQHGLEWMKGESFRLSLPSDSSRAMLDKLIAMYNRNPLGSDIEYSLQN
jgi:hypothetical protein